MEKGNLLLQKTCDEPRLPGETRWKAVVKLD